MRTSRPLAVGLTPMETRRDAVRHVATRAERLGYDAFYLAEGWSHDAPVLLAELAARTDRIRLGTGVLNVWGRSAAGLAMVATSLDDVSGGRFTLGLGAGSPPLAEGWHGVGFRSPVRRLDEVLRRVRTLLDGGRPEPVVASPHRPLRLGVRPAHRVPLTLAALGPEAVRLAGEHADAWYPFLLPHSALADRLRLLAEGAARGRATPDPPRVCPGLPAAVSTDPARARETAAWWVGYYLAAMGPLYREALRHAGHGAAVDAVVAANPTGRTTEVPEAAEVLFDELAVWGDPRSARCLLDRWYAAGAHEPVIVLPPLRPIDELDGILEAMAP